MCLLDDVLVGVQALCCVVHQQLVFASSFSGCGASNHEPPTMGIAVALLSILAAIYLRWSRMMARSRKPHDPSRRFKWPAADRADNKIYDMVIPLTPLHLHQDSIASAGLNT